MGDFPNGHVDEHGSPQPKSPVTPKSPPLPLSPKDRPTSRIRVMTRRRSVVLGVITGLPCSLDFSISETNLTKVQSVSVGPSPHDIKTTVEIDPNHFIPGSIVLYRTWVVGSNIDTKVFEDEDDDDYEAMQNEDQLGILAQLWGLLGFDQRSAAIEYAVKLGREGLGTLDSWFPFEETHGWPPGLWEAVKDLDMEELNIALYRTHEEEADITSKYSLVTVPMMRFGV